MKGRCYLGLIIALLFYIVGLLMITACLCRKNELIDNVETALPIALIPMFVGFIFGFSIAEWPPILRYIGLQLFENNIKNAA